MTTTMTAPIPAATNVWTPYVARITRITDDNADTRTFELEFTDPVITSGFRFQPGQFNMLYLPGVGEAAISISGRSRAGEPLLHTVRRAGNVTGALFRLKPGETLGLRGPFGSHWPMQHCGGQDVILIAGGIGLAPLRPALYDLIDRRALFGRVTLLYGARDPSGRLYPSEFAAWRQHGIDIQETVDFASGDWLGNVGVVTLLLERLHIPAPENTQVLTCGPEVMMRHSALGALAKHIPPENIWVSLERNMNCAVGFCGHCQLGPAFICKDGPVLRYDTIVRYLGVKQL